MHMAVNDECSISIRTQAEAGVTTGLKGQASQRVPVAVRVAAQRRLATDWESTTQAKPIDKHDREQNNSGCKVR